MSHAGFCAAALTLLVASTETPAARKGAIPSPQSSSRTIAPGDASSARLEQSRQAASGDTFTVVQETDRLVITRGDHPVADYVFRDAAIRRPYLCRVHSPAGVQVTRNHPPVPEVDATDHATMHPGIWYGFGDINGSDFWRNKATVRHVALTAPPTVSSDRVTFATQSELVIADNAVIGTMENRIQIIEAESLRLFLWDATFQSADHELRFGDQEEMGFGARLATPLTEQNTGALTNSDGLTTAAGTWGRTALWSDYTGQIAGRPVGLTMMAAPDNFRESWWHNRDYGLTVANPFGRAAMTGAAPCQTIVPRGMPWTIRFAAAVHDTPAYDPGTAWDMYREILAKQEPRR